MWNKLTMKEKAALIKVAVSNGLTDLDLIKDKYNKFTEGGNETVLINRDGAVPRLPENAPYVESYTKPNNFLGSDYVHNFIQNHKEAMGVGVDSFNTPAHKIDSAYMNQVLNGGAQINGVTNTKLSNKVVDNTPVSNIYTKSVFESTPNYFPTRTTKYILENINDGNNVSTSSTFTGYLPSLGYFTNKQALGGSLLNQNNPIESFNGGRRLPVVRYDMGGTLNENTNVNVTENGNKVIYDYSQNDNVNNPGYLGNETYNLGVLPNIEVNASTNSARSNEAYRNYLLRHEQNEFNNYIREGTAEFAKPLQEIMLSAMAAPVLNPVVGRVGGYIGTKIPTVARNVGKHLFTAGQHSYDIYSTGNSIFNALKE